MKLLTPFLFLVSIWFSSCADNVASGETSGSENGNAFSGTIYRQNGDPAESVEVIVTLAKGEPFSMDSANSYKDTTDIEGKYSILLPDSGVYNLLALDLNTGDVAMLPNISIASNVDTLPSQRLSRPGIVVISVPHHMAEGHIYITGTHVLESLPSQGEMRFTIPAENNFDIQYRLVGDTSSYLLMENTTVNDGDSVFIDSLAFWKHMSEISIDVLSLNLNAGDTLENFPLLLRFPDSLVMNDVPGSESKLRIMDASGNMLTYSVESWRVGERLIWVKLPQVLSDQNYQLILCSSTPLPVVAKFVSEEVFDSSTNFSGVWHLNESPSGALNEIRDQSPLLHHGQAMGGMTASNSVEGVIGKALQFNGVDQYIDMGPIVGPSGRRKALTLSAWVQAESFVTGCSDDWDVIAGVREGENGRYYKLQKCDSSWSFEYDPESNGPVLVRGGAVEMNEWTLVTGVYNGTSAMVYANGTLVGSAANVSDTSYIQDQIFHIGNRSDIQSEFFAGAIDEVRLEDVARSEFWIRFCYETQKSIPEIVRWQLIR